MPAVHFNSTIKGGLPVYVEAVVSTWSHDGGGLAVEGLDVFWPSGKFRRVPDHLLSASDILRLEDQAGEMV